MTISMRAWRTDLVSGDPISSIGLMLGTWYFLVLPMVTRCSGIRGGMRYLEVIKMHKPSSLCILAADGWISSSARTVALTSLLCPRSILLLSADIARFDGRLVARPPQKTQAEERMSLNQGPRRDTLGRRRNTLEEVKHAGRGGTKLWRRENGRMKHEGERVLKMFYAPHSNNLVRSPQSSGSPVHCSPPPHHYPWRKTIAPTSEVATTSPPRLLCKTSNCKQ